MADQPFTVALGLPVVGPSLLDALRAVRPDVEVVHAPYAEPEEVRSARGRSGGRRPDSLPAPPVDDATRAALARADAFLAMDVPEDIGALAPRLRWVQSVNAGYDRIDLAGLAAAGIRLSNASGLGAASIAEFVFGRLLQVWKNLRLFDAQQERHEWSGRFGTELTGRTLGVVGLGAIGRQVARRARAFDMHVLATRASAQPGAADPDVDELFPAAELDAVLARCDAVVASLPATPATTDLFDAGRFAAMRPGSVFCNVGRGVQVVEADLVDSLASGHLRAAVLDVTRVEPLPAGDPLWEAPNLYLSPHSSVSLDRYLTNLEALFVENVRRLLTGERLVNEVDLPG